ncbi:ATP-binding protein [Caulobacter sp. BP25]|uniref:ATP-binding protein n=1 Tax=Caulobacter sp. BP25 TaxID=2048900 RepID=UPI000C12AED8|nr:ATP-binding protein [Caulobacter sp. BP25]PHY17499.1 hybrid sensor histidine kinase/response regulator [Caulobacter sp. BP25]
MIPNHARSKIRDNPLALALLGQASRNSMATMGVQAAAAIGVTLASLPSERPFYWAWLAVTLTVLAARIVADRLLAAAIAGRALANRLDLLAAMFSSGLIISAALWAFLACARIPIDSQSTRYVIIVVLSALAGGATGVLSPLKLTGRIYIALILLPASLTLIAGQLSETVLGVLGVVFCLVMLAGHRNNHALLVDSIQLRDQNRDLVEALARRSHDLNSLNQDLEARVALRTRQLQQATERAQAANEAKSRFLATVSHEMRTPLNAILGVGQILTRSALGRKQREQVLEMKGAARRLRMMIDDVLDLCQLDDGELRLKPRPFPLAALAQSLDHLHRPAAEARGLRLTMQLEAAPAETRLGDVDRLRQVVSVLIDNALKFTHQGGVDCRISGAGGKLRIEVSDTGDGVAPDKMAVIFERFSQIDDSTKRSAGGIGVGLTLCQGLVTAMGGEMTAASQPGRGSTFTLVIPCPVSTPAPQRASVPQAEGEEDAPTLLVVDDNAMNREIIAALVEPFGIACGFAADGREAVEAWRRQPWDAIFMDVHMPVMDGVEATRAIRQEEDRLGRPRVPIVAVTASLMQQETASYQAAGMDDVLPKPIEVSALAEMLARCVGGGEDTATKADA